MKITNHNNLPEALVSAIRNDQYVKRGDVSVTELLQPRQVRFLKKRYLNEESLEVDASERIWTLLGSAVHSVLERVSEAEGYYIEKPLDGIVDDIHVSGKSDLFDSFRGVLWDYKITSVWSCIKGVKPEWEEQMNLYAHMWRNFEGYEVKKLKICAILRDWSKLEALRDSSYPQRQVVVLEVPCWSDVSAKEFLHNKIAGLRSDEMMGAAPDCTPEEQWRKRESWAVKSSPASKRALKVFYNHVDAEAFWAQKPGRIIEHRPGMAVRCEQYCEVRDFCNQYKRERGDSQ